MTSSMRYLACYVFAAFVALLALTLWPMGSDTLLVVVSVDETTSVDRSVQADRAIFSLLADNEARLLNKVGTTMFIVATPKGEGGAFVNQFYEKGAFLVLNAAGLAGCSKIEETTVFRGVPNDQTI